MRKDWRQVPKGKSEIEGKERERGREGERNERVKAACTLQSSSIYKSISTPHF